MVTSSAAPRQTTLKGEACIQLSWYVGRCQVVIFVMRDQPRVFIGGGLYGMEWPLREADLVEVEALAERFNSIELRDVVARVRVA